MKSEALFKDGPVGKAIAQMSIPAVITTLVVVLYNMADLYFIAQTDNYLMIAGISLASPLFLIISAMGTLIGGGGCIAIAQALGAKEKDRPKQISAFCAISSVVIGVLVSIVLFLNLNDFLIFLGCDSTTLVFTEEYIVILLIGSPFIIFAGAFANIIRGIGAIKASMISSALSTAVNLILDPLLILQLNMGVSGAAIATVLGNIVGSIYLIAFIIRKTQLSVHPKDAKLSLKDSFRLFALGLPSSASNLMMCISSTLQNQRLVTYGTIAVSAMGVAGKATMVVAMVVMGICMGVQPLLAYNYGAENVKRTKQILLRTALISCISASCLAIACYCLQEPLISMFVNEEQVIRLGRHILMIHLISAPFISLYFLGMNFVQAAGNALWATLLSIARQGTFLIPLYYMLEHFMGLDGIIFAMPISDILSSIFALGLCMIQYHRFSHLSLNKDKQTKQEITTTLVLEQS